MNPLTRFFRFNLVGLVGIVTQLTTLTVLNHVFPRHYLLTSTLAVELTLLHNFVWHLHFTWPATSQRHTREALPQLLRFHLSNGLISLLGDLILMHLFVHSFHSPILLANALSIACCGLANFLLAHNWVFAHARPPRTDTQASITSCLFLLLFGSTVNAASAQSTDLPSAPSPHSQDYGVDCAYANVFLGPAVSLSSATGFTGTAGITVGQYAARPARLSASPQFELGVAAPLANHALDGLVSANYMFATKIPYRDLYPSLTAGYTRFFVTGNAINFGVSIDIRKQNSMVRLELRDYFLISEPEKHLLGFRVGLGSLIAD